MPTWWADRPQSIGAPRRVRARKPNVVTHKHPSDPLSIDRQAKAKPSTPEFSKSHTAPQLHPGQVTRLSNAEGTSSWKAKFTKNYTSTPASTNFTKIKSLAPLRPNSSPDLMFSDSVTSSLSKQSQSSKMQTNFVKEFARRDARPKQQLQASPCSAVFNLRINKYNIANQLQQGLLRNGGIADNARGKRKWPANELREAIKCRLAEEEYDNLTQLRVGVIREDCEKVLSLEVGALRAHPDFLQILAEEAQRRTDDLNAADLPELEYKFLVHKEKLHAEKEEKNSHDKPLRSPRSPTVHFPGATAFSKVSSAAKAAIAFDSPSPRGRTVFEKNATVKPHLAFSNQTSEGKKSGGKRGNKDGLKEVDQTWIAAFGRLREDGEVHREKMFQALEIVGFEKPQATWIEQSVKSVVGNTATLNQDEFCRVIQSYLGHQRESLRSEFDKFDHDQSNSIETNELADMMQVMGNTPFPDVLAEIVDEVDEDGSRSLSFDEFVQVLDLLRKRAGFTQREINEFYTAFDRYRVAPLQEISTESLFGILGWLGYSPETEDVEDLVKETDTDKSGKLNRTEFLHAMRIYREREIAKIRAFFVTNDVDGSGTLGKSELLLLMDQMGYTVRAEVLKELSNDAGVEADGAFELSFESFWILLKLYRFRQGYLTSEINEFKDVFLRYSARHGQKGPSFNRNSRSRSSIEALDVDDPELEMGTIQLGKALRWMGYATTLDQQQVMVNEIDVDGSGALSFSEFVKLMCRWDAQCLKIIRSRFKRADMDGDGFIGTHCSSELSDALIALGHVPVKERVYRVVKARSIRTRGQVVDESEFVKLLKEYREDDKVALRDTAGFPEKVVERFRILFERYDKDGSGDIQNQEMSRLLADVFPESMTSYAERRRLQHLLSEVDVNGDGRLDFGDFLLMMRQYQDKKDEEQLDKERTAVEDCKFTRPEVEQFRAIFHGSTSEASFGSTSSMSLAEVRRVLSRVVPISEQQVIELSGIIKEVSKGTSVITGFPEFLRLMKRLQDDNFANLNGAAAEIAQRERTWGM